MAAPVKSKAPTNGELPKGSGKKPAASTEAEPVAISGRPDKAVFDAEQAKSKSEIDALQATMQTVRDKINLATSSGNGHDKRSALKAELEGLRGQQSTGKNSRGKVIEQLRQLQEGIFKKVKDLQASKSKIPYKTVAEIDAHIAHLDKQIESGNLKIAEEKRALLDLNSCKRNRRVVEAFQQDQDKIDEDRKVEASLRAQLDDPESKAVSDRYEAIKAELDELKKQSDVAYAGRSKLFEERDKIQNQLSVLFDAKRKSAAAYREDNDKYYAKLNEDRARRAERAQAQRTAEEAEKKAEIAERLREEASAPAFQYEIEDCQTLIDALSGKTSASAAVAFKSVPSAKASEIVGVSRLEPRKVEVDEGLVARGKKVDEESYFVGGKGKRSKRGKNSNASGTATPETAATPSNANLNLPLATLSALFTLSIPPPTSTEDLPRVVEDLRTKKAWYEANQTRVTAENVRKAEQAIGKLTKGSALSGDVPAEPVPTPAVAAATESESTPVSSTEVKEQLEAVKEASEARVDDE